MTHTEIDKLFNSNMEELNKMNVASGSMVKAFLQAIESNGATYVRLNNAVVQGHCVNYTLVEGDQTTIKNVAAALGLQLNDSVIEVFHA